MKNTTNGTKRLALMIAAVALAALPLQAADVIKVASGENVQAVIDGLSGDVSDTVIRMKKGRHDGGIVIPPGLTGLTLEGVGRRTIVDAKPSGEAVGPGIQVYSENVTIRKMRIRHAERLVVFESSDGESKGGKGGKGDISLPGVAVLGGMCKGLTVERVRVENCIDGGVLVTNEFIPFGGVLGLEGIDDVTVRLTQVRGSGSAVDITGNNATVFKIRGTLLHGRPLDLFNHGDGDVDERGGIVINGDNGTVARCRMNNIGSSAIRVNGNVVLVERNRVKWTLEEGIDLSTDSAQVLRNRIIETGESNQHAIEIDILPQSELETRSYTVDRNRVRRSAGGGIAFGIKFFDKFPVEGLVLTRNSCRMIGSNGNPEEEFEGTPHRSAFDLLVDGAMIERNRAVGGSATGFRVIGSANQLVRNAANRNLRDGILIDGQVLGDDGVTGGDKNVLDRNRANRNQGEGIENGPNATNTTLTNNRARGNRIEFGQSNPSPNAIQTFDGNNFGPDISAPGDAVPGEI